MATMAKMRPQSRKYREGGRGNEGILTYSISKREHPTIAVPMAVIESDGDISEAAELLGCVQNSVLHWMGKCLFKYVFAHRNPMAALMEIKRTIEAAEKGE